VKLLALDRPLAPVIKEEYGINWRFDVTAFSNTAIIEGEKYPCTENELKEVEAETTAVHLSSSQRCKQQISV